jgi:hypothetical protein
MKHPKADNLFKWFNYLDDLEITNLQKCKKIYR